MDQTHLIILADRLGAHMQRKDRTIAAMAGAHTRLFGTLRAGGGCNVRTFRRVMQWFADEWPADLEWPASVPRPARSPLPPQRKAS